MPGLAHPVLAQIVAAFAQRDPIGPRHPQGVEAAQIGQIYANARVESREAWGSVAGPKEARWHKMERPAMDYEMTWIDRQDEGMADVMVKDQIFYKIVSVPLSRRDVVVRQKRRFDELVGQNIRGGKVDWAAVSAAFQAHVDALLAS